MKKSIFLVMFALALVISLSLSGYAKVTLRLAWWGSQGRHERTQKIIQMFEAKYPDIDIEPVFLGWSGYWEKMAVQAAGKALPDVWQQDYICLGQYARRDLLLDLNPYVENGSLDLKNVEESAISGGVIRGGLYGVNLGMNALATAYDPELFKNAGMEEPNPDKWTWEDYMDTAYKLHNALGIYGAWDMANTGNLQGFSYYLRQMGKEVFKEDETGLGYEDDKLLADCLRMEIKGTKDGVFPPIPLRQETDGITGQIRLFTKKMLGMCTPWSNEVVKLEEGSGRLLKLTILPTSKNQVQKGLYLKPSMFFSVTKYTACPKEAVKFIDFVTNDVECNKILMGERGVPISSEVRKALAPLSTDLAKRVFGYIDLAAKYSSKISPPWPGYAQQLFDYYETIHGKVVDGQMTPEEGAKQFREEANKVIAKYLD